MPSMLVVSESIIDECWYYGSLFSPKKSIDVDENFSVSLVHSEQYTHVDDGIPQGEKCQQPISTDKEMLKAENSSPFFESAIESDSARIPDEDAEKEAECLASMLRALDKDGDGRVSSGEIVRFLERLNLEMPKDEVELAVRSVFSCGDNFLTTIECNEFYRILLAEKEEDVENVKVGEKAICEAFNVFDKNGDGFISALELADVLSRLGFVEGEDLRCSESMIESADYDGDEFVDIHEFRHLINRTSSPTYPACLQCVAAL